MQGADEIDVVMNLGYFMEDNFEELTEELQEIKRELSPRPFKGNPRDRSFSHSGEHPKGIHPSHVFRCGLHQDLHG